MEIFEGTFTESLFEFSVIEAPPDGAAAVSLTVSVGCPWLGTSAALSAIDSSAAGAAGAGGGVGVGAGAGAGAGAGVGVVGLLLSSPHALTSAKLATTTTAPHRRQFRNTTTPPSRTRCGG
jgi:hypothetical protein